MDYQHFRLRDSPFQAASPNSAIFLSPTHIEGLSTLEWGLSRELNGFTLLTGDAGTGKTTLIYSLLQRDFKQVRIAYIIDPRLSFLEILRVILDQLNLYCKGSTKLDYLEALDRFLKLRQKEERVAIIVDESQDLSDDVLEDLRLLSNHGQRNDRCLQLILVGQPELAERLKKPELRQLNQRISARGVLSPLNPEQAIKYVECRLRAQGGECAYVFEPGALECLLKPSDGIPRKINMLCQNAMRLAYSNGAKKVALKTAKMTVREYSASLLITNQISTASNLQRKVPLIGGAIVGAALTSALVGFVYLHVPSNQAVKQTVSSNHAMEQKVPPERTGEQLDIEQYAGPAAMPPAVVPLASHPVEYRTSLVPEAAVHAASKDVVAGPVIAREMRAIPAPPAAATSSAATQEQVGVRAPLNQRRQITVRYGDTLEKIAIRYFGSKSGINELIDANPQLIDIDRLHIGQVIYFPSGSTSKTSHDHHSLIPSTDLPNHVEADGDETSGPNTARVENLNSSAVAGTRAASDHNATAGIGPNVSRWIVSAGNRAVDPDAPRRKIVTGAEAESDPPR